MKRRISATQAARKFSEIVNRVRYRNESFVVERAGEPVCEIIQVKSRTVKGRDLLGLLSRLPRPDDEYLEIVEEIIKNQQPIAPSLWRR